jgi:hypothetical protein
MPFLKLYQNTNNQTTRRADTLRKIGFENVTLGDDRAHKITSRIQNTRRPILKWTSKPSSRSWAPKED